jgi:hypothetical protein
MIKPRGITPQHLATFTLTTTLSVLAGSAQADILQQWLHSFEQSELNFNRSNSNTPFLPLAFVDARNYQDSKLTLTDGSTVEYDQSSVNQGAILPFLMTPRDVLVIGDWVSMSSLKPNSDTLEDFDVLSVGIPIGWMRQLNDDWQVGGFVMPLGHKATLEDSSWNWETLGGGFGRYVQTERLWWAFGVYFDINTDTETWLPYLGASYEFNDRWTLSAVMPWPAILYAPNRDTLFRFGAAPSGSSWLLDTGGERISYALDGWDLAFSGEHRIWGDIWLELEAGIGGLKGLNISNGDWQEPALDVSTSEFITFGINFRPSLN